LRILRCEEGLTLVETIIALVLMLGLLAAFAGAMVVGLQSEVEVDKRLEASNLASSIVEYLGEGDNLRDNVKDNDGNYLEGKITLFITDDYQIYNQNEDTNTGNLDNSLFFNDIKLANNPDTSTTVSDNSTITIEEYNDIEGLYEVIINIEWLDRGNDWSHELVTLLAVD